MGQKQEKKIKIAVRDFAKPLVQQGDLGWEQSQGLTMDVGQQIHQEIQLRLQNECVDYEAEYQIQHRMRCEEISILVSGRCDGRFPASKDMPGLFPEENVQTAILEEIKTSYHIGSLKKQLAENPEHPYWLQLKTYLHFCRQKTDQALRGRLRLVCSRTRQEEIIELTTDDEEEFAAWCAKRCQQIVAEYRHLQDVKLQREALFQELKFPYQEIRSSQSELIDFVQNHLKEHQQLMIQAPTGLGKTAGVLFPALHRALKRGAPVLYLTPKNSQFQAALQFAEACHEQGLGLKVLVISARSKICLNTEVRCQAEHCQFADKYYDKLQAAGTLGQRDVAHNEWSAHYFSELGRMHQVCPYELSMTRLREADLIVCDYNYLISLRGGLMERYQHPYLPMPKPLLVIDEAHNLYVRAMENFSPAITRAFFQDLKAKESLQLLPRTDVLGLTELGLAIFQKKLSQTDAAINPYQDQIDELMGETQSVILARLAEGENISLEDPLFDLYSNLTDMCLLTVLESDTFRCLEQQEQNGQLFAIQLVCLDPGPVLQPLFVAFDRVLLFSATLKPFDFYRNMSGLDENTCLAAEFHSPFPREHKKIIMIPQIATSFRERQQHYPRIALVIKRTIPLAAGHYFAFFPSYGFMSAVAKELEGKLDDWLIYRQESALNANEIERILSMLQPDQPPCLVLAVQGGSLAEGMDFKGRGIRGVFVVGPGLPGFSPERKLMEDYYQKRYGKGRDYTYTFPAMARAVQAAGRVVRDHHERGLIIMMDRRFLQAEYAAAMPGDWYQNHPRELVSQQILQDIAEFWSNEPPLAEAGLDSPQQNILVSDTIHG